MNFTEIFILKKCVPYKSKMLFFMWLYFVLRSLSTTFNWLPLKYFQKCLNIIMRFYCIYVNANDIPFLLIAFQITIHSSRVALKFISLAILNYLRTSYFTSIFKYFWRISEFWICVVLQIKYYWNFPNRNVSV